MINKYLEKIAEVGLEKIALNAMKAREMASKVGILPVTGSQWKWGLRNLRNARGEALTGRALAEGKRKMGSLDNHSYDAVVKTNNTWEHSKVVPKEITKQTGGVLSQEHPYDNNISRTMNNLGISSMGTETAFAKKLKSKIDPKSEKVGITGAFFGDPVKYKSEAELAEDRKKLIIGMSKNKPTGINLNSGFVHTHPIPDNKNLRRVLQIKAMESSGGNPTRMRTTTPSGQVTELHKSLLKKNLSQESIDYVSDINIKADALRKARAVIPDNPFTNKYQEKLVKKMGMDSPKIEDLGNSINKSRKDIRGNIIRGDTQMFTNPTHQHQDTNNIINPHLNEESVSKIKTTGFQASNGTKTHIPMGMRTVYFDRTPGKLK